MGHRVILPAVPGPESDATKKHCTQVLLSAVTKSAVHT